MEFRGGKLHDIIPKVASTNKIVVADYSGIIGLIKFFNDTLFSVENFLSVAIFFLIYYSQEFCQITTNFAIGSLTFNLLLKIGINLAIDKERSKVENLINNRKVEYLHFSRKTRKYKSTEIHHLKPGQIIKISNGEEFPADCLIIDVHG